MSKNKEKKKKVRIGPIVFQGFWIFFAVMMILGLLVPLLINVIDLFNFQ